MQSTAMYTNVFLYILFSISVKTINIKAIRRNREVIKLDAMYPKATTTAPNTSVDTG